MARKKLSVWCYDMRVAELTAPKPWSLRCRYTAEAIDRWPGNVPLLSCSLPLTERAEDATDLLRRTSSRGPTPGGAGRAVGIASSDLHGMLERYGRDVAGAVVIAADDPPQREASVVPYTPESLSNEIGQLSEHPMAVYDDSELSIAGLQDKILLVDMGEGHWGRPVHGSPSTHILKLDDRLRPGLVAAEATCLGFAAELGLAHSAPQLTNIAGIDCLIVERFDRRTDADGTVHRADQEDMCQALARDPDANAGRGKYQNAGGPSLSDIATLLDRYALDGPVELTHLVRVLTFTILIGNADAHGKNLALLHPTASEVTLAPVYDTVPTVLWPQLRTNAAMSVNSRWQLSEITLDDIVVEASRWSLATNVATVSVQNTAEQLLALVRPARTLRSLCRSPRGASSYSGAQ